MALGIRYNSPVILSFSIIATIVYFANTSMAGTLTPLFSLAPPYSFNDPLTLFNMVSYVVGHASMEHLMGNLTFILLLGPILEEKYGSFNVFLMILFTAIITALGNMLIFGSGLWGASGIVFMLIVLVSFANVEEGQIPLTFILVVLLFVGKEIIQSMGHDNVSQYAHIIGGACGGVFGLTGMFNTKKEVKVSEPIEEEF